MILRVVLKSVVILKQPFLRNTGLKGMIDVKIVILDASTLGEDINLSMFSELGEVVIHNMTKPDEVADRIADCNVVVINKIKLNEDNLKFAKNLKLICVAATGFDNVSTEACKKLGIGLCNVKGYSTDSVAQTTVALALSLAMHIPFFNEYVVSGAYTKSGVQNCLSPVFYELSGKTWGIVGYGNIGKRVADIANAFGCRVLAYARTKKDGVECVSLDTLLKESDIVSVHLPLSDETRGLIGENELKKMKKSAILINTGRGAVTDEEAVAEAVESGEIGAFGTDVYSVEPIEENSPLTRLYGRENVIFSPHLAWGAYEARMRCMREIVLNIKAFFGGEKRNRIV